MIKLTETEMKYVNGGAQTNYTLCVDKTIHICDSGQYPYNVEVSLSGKSERLLTVFCGFGSSGVEIGVGKTVVCCPCGSIDIKCISSDPSNTVQVWDQV